VHIDDAGSVIGQEDAGSSTDELERLFNVSSLSERDLRLVREHHIQGLSMPDVASKYDMETRTVEQVIYRSMKALRQAARDDA
jgi:DNA-directed RNA polymerase specialized sigma24 family protein